MGWLKGRDWVKGRVGLVMGGGETITCLNRDLNRGKLPELPMD